MFVKIQCDLCNIEYKPEDTYCRDICNLDDICLDCHEYHIANCTNIKTNTLYCNCCKAWDHSDFDDSYDVMIAISIIIRQKKYCMNCHFDKCFKKKK